MSSGGAWEGKLIFIYILQCYEIDFYCYFRNFEESEDELRNEVVESLEKLSISREKEKREEASGSFEDTEKLGESG